MPAMVPLASEPLSLLLHSLLRFLFRSSPFRSVLTIGSIPNDLRRPRIRKKRHNKPQPWNENDRPGRAHRLLPYKTRLSPVVPRLSLPTMALLSFNNATAVPEDIMPAMDVSVANKAVMICDALWVNGKVTLDV